ncbi:MAG: DUF4118 domain-containing protein [Nakamurella sp.]
MVTDSPGKLRVYLGAAPGVGKTVAMLGEGRRRVERGTDVVVAVVEDHGRAFTAAQLADLEVVPRRTVNHRGVELTDLDLPAVLARNPQVAIVDELAHRNAPGSGNLPGTGPVNERRWQDVQQLLDAGIDVITTVNIQHIESLNDVVSAITGVVQTETVPDAVVRAADQIELVDMTPQALRRRMAHGHIYPPDRVDTALGHYFREGNLTALRELALLWVADRVEEGLARYRTEHEIRGTWAARERIVVALTGGPEGSMLLRRGARIAGRMAGRDLVAVHVVRSDGSVDAVASDAGSAEVERQRQLVQSLGGTLHTVVGDDISAAVLDFARAVNGTQIVVGVSRHSTFTRIFRPSTSMAIVRNSGDIDVHVVTHERASGVGHRRLWTPAYRPNRWAWPASVLVPAVLTAILLPWRDSMNLSTLLLIFLLGVLASSLIGGVLPAAVSALVAGLLANYVFTPPTGSLSINEPGNAFALVVFLIVGMTVASIVDRSRRRATDAARGRAEAQLLAAVATRSAASDDPLREVLRQAREAFGMASVELRRGAEVIASEPVELTGSVGAPAVSVTVDADVPGETAPVELLMSGRTLAAADRKLAEVLASQAAVALQRRELTAEAALHDRLRQSDAVRTAVLAAVSHDLRSPLATIKASVSSLLDSSVTFSAADSTELLMATDSAADQLDDLLTNLLDLSRLQTGVLVPVRRPVGLDEVVHRGLIGLPSESLELAIPDDLPLADTDAGLLERVVANIVGNALRHSPDGQPVRVLAGEVPSGVSDVLPQSRVLQVRVVDHGPGVALADRPAMFLPFQRLGDAPNGNGLGLGLAVARGLAEAVDATIEVEDTPGGGLTMVITVPMAAAHRRESTP